MQSPFKRQPKSIKQIIKDLILKEIEKESKKKINIIVIPTRIGQSCWGTRNLRRISPSNHYKIDQGAIFSPINCSQISPVNQSQGSPSNYRIKNKSKYEKLLKMNNQQQPNQINKKEQKFKTEPRQKSQSVNTTKPFHQRLPSLPRRINYFAEETKSLQLKLTDTIEGYQVKQDDMSFEIDEYVQMKYIKQIKHQEI
ncbi:unnamed protein product [Paramecium primaurelia]|uniref:Uncharacterized protein n=1 Tax=Paramecium primaurelia TaxID=5886 RepID=A0A8S1LIG1_PARPR|nr:unnamed protein product [Paramecium primaurelia]